VETTGETNYQPLTRKATFDAVVIGGGITGLTAALLLKQEGMKVAVLEAGRIASGATGYTTAKVTALHGLIYQELVDRHGRERAEAYASANAAAIEQIASMIEKLGIACEFERANAYTWAETSDGVERLRREVDACRAVGLPAELVTETPLPFPVMAAVRLGRQGMFHPRAYCMGLAAAVHGGKGRVYENARVAEVEEKQRVVHVKAEKVTLSTSNVVVATQIPFMGDGNFYAKEYPYRAYAVAARVADGAPDGMFISTETPTRSVRPYGSSRTRWVVVSGESHKVGQDPDPDDHYEAIETWARERLPGIEAIDHRWSAEDFITMDGMPYVGRITPDHRRVFVATGFRKWGMTNGTAAAHIITDAIMGRDNPWAEAFDATRTRPRQSARRFVTQNVNVAKQFAGKYLSSESALEQVAPGTGEIVDASGESMAVYRDDSGVPHALSSECTHLGCEVAWNAAERSWDCPCHGSRFGTDGRVLQGPANQDLEKKEISEESAAPR
jgi:glycine/D-amino acid oxidase-like deaminating enzyme/nitrite reductase/ring-hydroxylating ferredoxin subunit